MEQIQTERTVADRRKAIDRIKPLHISSSNVPSLPSKRYDNTEETSRSPRYQGTSKMQELDRIKVSKSIAVSQLSKLKHAILNNNDSDMSQTDAFKNGMASNRIVIQVKTPHEAIQIRQQLAGGKQGHTTKLPTIQSLSINGIKNQDQKYSLRENSDLRQYLMSIRKGNATQLAVNKSLEDELISTAYDKNPFQSLKVNLDNPHDYTVNTSNRRPPPQHNIRLSLDFLNSIKAPQNVVSHQPTADSLGMHMTTLRQSQAVLTTTERVEGDLLQETSRFLSHHRPVKVFEKQSKMHHSIEFSVMKTKSQQELLHTNGGDSTLKSLRKYISTKLGDTLERKNTSIDIMKDYTKNLLQDEGTSQLNSPSPSPRQLDQTRQFDLDSELGVSLLTERYNREAKTVLEHYDHSSSKKQIVVGDFREKSKKKHSEMLNTAGREIRTLQYRLDKIFAKGRGSHIMITPGVPINIDVEPDNVINAIVQVPPSSDSEKAFKFLLTPIGGGQAPRVDIKVFMSLYFKEPEEYRCDKQVVNKLKFTFNPQEYNEQDKQGTTLLTARNTKKFQQQVTNLYLSFTSLMGFSFSLTVTEYTLQKRIKKVKHQTPDLPPFDPLTPYKDPVEIKRETCAAHLHKFLQRFQVIHQQPKNFIKHNLHGLRDSPTRGKSLRQKLADRIVLASERKEELIQKEREKIRQQKSKWESIKESKLREWHMYGNVARKRAIKQAYIVIFLARHISSIAHQNFLEEKKQKEDIDRCIRFCKTFPQKAKLLILKRGATSQDRNAALIQFSMIFVRQFAYKPYKAQASGIVHEFLEAMGERFKLKTLMYKFRGRMILIQRSERSRSMSLKARLMLFGYYWENMKGDLSRILLSDLKQPEEAKKVSTKVFSIPHSVKQQYIRDYSQFVRAIYNIKFFDWRMRKLKYLRQKATFNFKREIERIQMQIASLENVLFEDVNKQALEILMKSDGISRISLGIKINIQNIKWNLHKSVPSLNPKLFRQVSIVSNDSNQTEYFEESDLEDEDSEIEPPGPCPGLTFLPSKVQLIQMILKAAYQEQAKSTLIRT